MRTFMLSTVLLLLSTSAFAQSANSDFNQSIKQSGEIGLDAYYFINLLRENTSGPFDQHFISYRHNFENGAIRSGIGFRFQKDLNDLDSVARNNTNTALNMRLGYEWQYNFGNRWQLFYGLDGRFRYLESKSKQSLSGDLSVTTAKSQTLGVGPVLGLKFRLNERLSLSTETSYDFDYLWSNSNGSTNGRRLEMSYNYPTSLFLLIKI